MTSPLITEELINDAESNAVPLALFQQAVIRELQLIREATMALEKMPEGEFEYDSDLMDSIHRLEEFTFAFGRDDRLHESREAEQQRKVEAKKKAPDLENAVMWMDRSVQRFIGNLGANILFLSMHGVHGVIRSFLRLMDCVPKEDWRFEFSDSGGLDDDGKAIFTILVNRCRATPSL